MSAYKLVSNPQAITPSNTNDNTLEYITRKSGKVILAILVTSGSIQFNASGAIVSSSATHTAGDSSEKLMVSIVLNDTGGNDQKVVIHFKAGTNTDSFIVSIV